MEYTSFLPGEYHVYKADTTKDEKKTYGYGY